MALDKHFAILQLPSTATQAEVRRAYRKLLMDWHPDRVAGSDSATKQEAHERTMQLAAAYAALKEHFRKRRRARWANPHVPRIPPAMQKLNPPRRRRYIVRPKRPLLVSVWVVGGIAIVRGLRDLVLWLM